MSWTNYENHPWAGIETNKREWYVPSLIDWYIRESTYARFVTNQFNLGGDIRTEKMHVTKLVPPHANFDELALRQLWMNSSYIDSKRREITFKHYGGKMALHEYDDLITYWKKNNRAGLIGIINSGLGVMMMRTINMLARNAFLSNSFAMYGDGGTSFNSVTSSDTVSTSLIHDIHLGMAEREVPYARGVDGSAPFGNIICITTPGVLRDLRNEVSNNSKGLEFVNAMSYANAVQLVRGEVGTYAGVRFVQTMDACLFNTGEIEVQATIDAAVSAGDGAPDSASTAVDGVYYVGQPGNAVTHYIEVDDVTGFEVGRRVTIHVDRTSDFGVTNGVDYRDGKATTRRIVSIDVGNNRLAFDEPIMEDFTTDLGSGVYGYVTQGRNIHTMTFVGGMDGVVAGNLRAPEVRVIDPVDDFKAMYRTSWSGRFGYQVFEPHVFENVFLAGSNREKGARYTS